MLVVAVGCGGGDDDAKGSGGSTTEATGTPGGGGGSSCGASDGTTGVIRTFCDGPATATVTIDGKEHTVSGGTCVTGGGYDSFNAGVVVDSSYKGTKPDYVGVNLPEKAGSFENITVSVTFDGTGYAVTENTGTTDGRTATFSGTDRISGATVSGKIDCG